MTQVATAWTTALAKLVLPAPVRALLRARHRDLVFRRAMRLFQGNPALAAVPGSGLLRDLIYGWGNEGMAGQHEYLSACVRHALDCGGPILECGSGLTTILVGVVACATGKALWSLEHSPRWADRVRVDLQRFRIDAVRLCVRPLKSYGTFSWYDPPLAQMPREFALVICDGPPGDTIGGRYGLVPVIGQRLSSGSTILLDDAARRDERSIASRWRVELSAASEMLGESKPYIRLVVGESPRDLPTDRAVRT